MRSVTSETQTRSRKTHHVEEDVEGIRLGRVRRDDTDEGDEVDPGRLDNDRSLLCKTECPARVADRVLAHPDAVGDQHCSKPKGPSAREPGDLERRRKDEREQSPFTATVELKNALLIFSSFSMKIESSFVSWERPWTAAIPVPVQVNHQRHVQRHRAQGRHH